MSLSKDLLRFLKISCALEVLCGASGALFGALEVLPSCFGGAFWRFGGALVVLWDCFGFSWFFRPSRSP